MTTEQIIAELKELGQNWENYLATTPYEIKHRKGVDGKTDILRRYSAMIQRTQELCRIQCNGV
jgi:plasmid replication initiation protein